MNSKPHRQNSDFQLKHFMANDCKTPDGAYVLLYGQRIDMENKIAHSDAQRKRREAKLAAAREVIEDPTSKRSAVLAAEADIIEIEADVPTWELNLKAAHQELATINRYMEELKPQCKHWSEDILAMSEASQEEEWRLELMCRAENFLISQGYIPHDHLNTMRNHPQFASDILPHLAQIEGKVLGLRMNKPTAGIADRLTVMQAPTTLLLKD